MQFHHHSHQYPWKFILRCFWKAKQPGLHRAVGRTLLWRSTMLRSSSSASLLRLYHSHAPAKSGESESVIFELNSSDLGATWTDPSIFLGGTFPGAFPRNRIISLWKILFSSPIFLLEKPKLKWSEKSSEQAGLVCNGWPSVWLWAVIYSLEMSNYLGAS